MPCDTVFRRNQTLSQRKAEVKTVLGKISEDIKRNRIVPVVSKRGAITFVRKLPNGQTVPIDNRERDDVTDACIYRAVMRTGSALERHAILKAEEQARVKVDPKLVAAGVHSHDGGQTWGTD